jgi:transketolase
VARTFKGAGASITSDQSDWHGKGLKPEQAEEAIAEIKQKAGLDGDLNLVVQVQKPEDLQPQETSAGEIQLPQYTLGEKVACRKAYGDALKRLAPTRWLSRSMAKSPTRLIPTSSRRPSRIASLKCSSPSSSW